MTDTASYVKRNKLKTAFKASKILKPIYDGGAVGFTQDGFHAYTTLQDDVLLTDTRSGIELGRSNGESTVTTFSLTTCLSTQNGTLIVARRSLQLQWFSTPFSESIVEPARVVHRAHDAPIITMSTDPSSHIFATGSSDGIVKVWSVEGGFCTHVLKGHGGVISAFTWDLSIPTDARLISAADDCRIRIWNLKNRKCESILEGHVSVVRGLAATEDGSLLVSAGRDQVINLWPLSRNMKASGLQPKSTIPVLETIESCGLIEVPMANSIQKGKAKEQTHTAIFTAGDKGQLRLWSLATGQMLVAEQSTFAKPVEIVNAFFLTSPPSLVSVRMDQNIISHSLPSLKPVRQLIGFNDEAIDCLFLATPSIDESPSETHLALATNSELIRLYDLSEDGFSNTSLLSGHTDIVLAMARSQDGYTFISGAKDNSARIWKYDTSSSSAKPKWACVGCCEGHLESVGAVALSKTSSGASFAVTASSDRTVKLWDLSSISVDSKEVVPVKALLTSKIHDKDINSLDVAPNDRMLASGSQDKTAKLFSISYTPGGSNSLETLAILKGHKRGVWSVKFSTTDQVLATASGDKTLRLWSVKDYTCLKTFEGHTNSVLRVDFISAGMQLVSCASDGLVKVWNIKDEETATTLDNHEERIWALAISKDEKRVVSGGADSVVTIWDDVTVEQEVEKAAQEEQLVLKNQDYENFVATKDYRSAILLALNMDQPRRLLNMFTNVSTQAKRDKNSLTGSSAVDTALQSLSAEDLLRLLAHVRDWNTSIRTSDVAQRVLHTILKGYTASHLLRLQRTDSSSAIQSASVRQRKGNDTIGDILEGLLPYTERHFNRADKALAQESFMLDYTLRQMDFDFRDVDTAGSRTATKPMLVDR